MEIEVSLVFGIAVIFLLIALLEYLGPTKETDKKKRGAEYRRKVMYKLMDKADVDDIVEISDKYEGVPFADFIRGAKPGTVKRVVSYLERENHVGDIHKSRKRGFDDNRISKRYLSLPFSHDIVKDCKDRRLVKDLGLKEKRRSKM